VDHLGVVPVAQRDILLGMMDIGAIWQEQTAYKTPLLYFLPPGATRAWGVCQARWFVAGDLALGAVLDPQFDPMRTVVLETGTGEEGTACSSRPIVTITELNNPNDLTTEVDFKEDGFLVLADVNYPGWEAFLDGERVPLLQADYAFRAVRISSGAHVVEFRYWPLSFWGGLILSAATSILMIVLLLIRRPSGPI
jgi:hypothetical protein